MHGSLADWLAHGTLWAFVMVFVSGILTSLTPCVYPLIPITVGVFGARDENVSKLRAFALGGMYVLGIMAMYTGLGVTVAMTAHGIPAYGRWLTNPWVVVPIALLFAALAASMFGAFEIRLPYALQQRLSTVGGRGYGGAFAMGLVGGIIAAPCTGPVLAGLLAYVATTRDVLLGGSLLAVYALGMGMLFLVLATFSLKLPKSGQWMEVVKSVFGIVFLVVGLYFLRPAWPWFERLTTSASTAFAVFAGVAVAAGLVAGGAHLSFHAGLEKKLRKGVGVALCAGGAIALVGWMLTPKRSVEWRRNLDKALAMAGTEKAPVLIDFGADYCGPCKKLDAVTFADPLVNAELHRFVTVKVDAGEESPEVDAERGRYQADTLPTVVLLDSQGKRAWTTHDYVGPGEMLEALRRVE